jgi:hemoglobin
MKTDLDNRLEIEKMVDLFYEKVNKDDKISFFFSDVVKVDWQKHLPKMYDFWESVILGHNTYSGNPMGVHLNLNEKSTISKEHFDRWLFLFNKNLDENFKGKYTEMARQRALSVATVMQLKINRY